MIFAVHADSPDDFDAIAILAESLRTFGGAHRSSSLRIYIRDDRIPPDNPRILSLLNRFEADLRVIPPPDPATLFFRYAGKVYAAARAEQDAGSSGILVWMDPDTVILKEPSAFELPDTASLGYRPVMHRNIGSPCSESPDAFWKTIYELLSIPDDRLFSMTTVADSEMIRPYINAGLCVVRPERGLLRHWRDAFRTLAGNPFLRETSAHEPLRRIFLHQAGLAGAAMLALPRSEWLELPPTYNYPILFDRAFRSLQTFNALEGVVTARWEQLLFAPDPAWPGRLRGDPALIEWLAERIRVPTR